MPRVIVITEDRKSGVEQAVLLDEQVHSIHLDSDHSAGQFIQRLGWAISDAEEVEHSRTPAAVLESSPELARAA